LDQTLYISEGRQSEAAVMSKEDMYYDHIQEDMKVQSIHRRCTALAQAEEEIDSHSPGKPICICVIIVVVK